MRRFAIARGFRAPVSFSLISPCLLAAFGCWVRKCRTKFPTSHVTCVYEQPLFSSMLHDPAFPSRLINRSAISCSVGLLEFFRFFGFGATGQAASTSIFYPGYRLTGDCDNKITIIDDIRRANNEFRTYPFTIENAMTFERTTNTKNHIH